MELEEFARDLFFSGISLFETSTCRLQVGRLLHESDRFPAADFLQLCNAEMESLQVLL